MTVADYRDAHRHSYDTARMAGAPHEEAACLAGDELKRLMREQAERQHARRAACQPRSAFADLAHRRVAVRRQRTRTALQEMRTYLDTVRRRSLTPDAPTCPVRTPVRPVRTRPIRPIRRMRGAHRTRQRPTSRSAGDPPWPVSPVLVGGAA